MFVMIFVMKISTFLYRLLFHHKKKTVMIFYIFFRLLHWVQSKIPDLPINNFTSDWNDGRAVGALVDAVAPGKLF
jgi:hypothetical protein